MTNNEILSLPDRIMAAMLGAAFGDSLGWPNERKSSKVNSSKNPRSLKGWQKKEGGRFYPYYIAINPGEYSDDTQMILALSRSLLIKDCWIDYWRNIELPQWLIYERGGGSASKKAANSWGKGKAPWDSKERNKRDFQSYFSAGGNGVAMRVLPHIILNSNKENFDFIRKSILQDGISTHGHPAALVGALVYGLGLFEVLKVGSHLEYGKLPQIILDQKNLWSSFPKGKEVGEGWLENAKKAQSEYSIQWEAAVSEIESYLKDITSELSKGSLARDSELLKEINCFNKKISGSGLVAASSSIYLASRYASDPTGGVIKAAYLHGADTDTIASMTGGLLGLINGSHWLSNVKDQLQDSKYIVKISNDLFRNNFFTGKDKRITESEKERWISGLLKQKKGEDVIFTDESKGEILESSFEVGESRKFKVEKRKILLEYGQTIYIDKIVKGDFSLERGQKDKHQQTKNKANNEAQIIVGPKLIVKSFTESIGFFKSYLGLEVKKQTNGAVVFSQGLVLVPESYKKLIPNSETKCLVYIKTTNLKEKFNRMKKAGVNTLSSVEKWNDTNLLFFRCLDPDGNIIEVFSFNEE